MDLYSFGIIVYEILIGVYFFGDLGANVLIKAYLEIVLAVFSTHIFDLLSPVDVVF